MERATLQARCPEADDKMMQNPGIWAFPWELNKALNLSLFTHNFFFFFLKVFSGLYFDILTSPNQDYFFVNRDLICLYLLFNEILKIKVI
jgi:hypothetical protein